MFNGKNDSKMLGNLHNVDPSTSLCVNSIHREYYFSIFLSSHVKIHCVLSTKYCSINAYDSNQLKTDFKVSSFHRVSFFV